MEQPVRKPITCLHNGTIGDVWASLPAIREFSRKENRKVIFYLEKGQRALYYEGATHPTRGEDGLTMVMLNQKMIDMMIPLLKAQDFVLDAKLWNGESINIDLNKIRTTLINLPYGCISRWYFYVFPNLACDLTKKWLDVPDAETDLAKGKIIVTRTERYLNPNIDYSFLKKYEEDVLFCGTPLEHVIFNFRYGLNTKHLIVNDFLELAQAIKQSKFHISNQTMAFQISQGLKHPRIVELCKDAPNVIPVGENAYDFYWQKALEYYVELLYNGEQAAIVMAKELPLPDDVMKVVITEE